MRLSHLFSALLSLCLLAQAADQVANPFPPVIAGRIEGLTLDAAGNKYIVGTQSGGSRDFNPAVGADFKTLNASGDAAFITRFNADGSYAWTKTFDGSNTEEGAAVVLANGVLYWFGIFESTDAVLNDSPTVYSSTSGTIDVFVFALNPDTGALVTSFGSSGFVKFGGSALDIVEAAAFDNGVLYFGGGTRSLDIAFNGVGSISCIGGGSTDDAYIAALNAASGAAVGAFSTDGVQFFGGTLSDSVSAITISAGVLYVTGEYSSSDAGLGVPGSIMSAGLEDTFVLALDTSGAGLPAFSGDGIQVFGGNGSDTPGALAVGNGKIFVGGTFFSNNATIDGTGSYAAEINGDVFILPLDISTGNSLPTYNSDGLLIFGGTGQEDVESLLLSGSTLYIGGQTVSSNFAVGGSTPFAAPSGQTEVYFTAVDESTGNPINTFGSDGVKQFGGTSSDTLSGMALSGTTLLATGFFASTNAGFDGAGTIDSTNFDGFLFGLNATTGNLSQAPMNAAISASVNPASVGTMVTFTGSATDPDGDSLLYTWNFGDGSPVAIGNPIQHAFASGAVFTVTLTVSDGYQGSIPATLMFEALAPSSGGTGVPNGSDGKPPVENPLNGLTISVAASEGGVIELAVNVSALRADEFTADTAFDGIQGRRANRLRTLRPTVKFDNAGLFVATSTAKDLVTDADTGKKGRKTLAVSRKETGETPLATGAPASLTIVASSLKGKFIFAGTKPDQVTFSGTVEVPAGMDVKAEQTVEFGMGNVIDSVVFDAKGKPRLPSALGRIKKAKLTLPKLKKDQTALPAGLTAKISITYQIANLVTAGFDTEGIQADLRAEEAGLKAAPRKIQMALVLAGLAYESLIDVDYKVAKKQDSGSFIKTRIAR